MRVLLVAAALAVVPSAVLAQGTFALKHQDLEPETTPALQMARKFAPSMPRPADLKGLPADLTDKARFFAADFGDKKVWMAAEGGKLYVDTDANLDLAGEKALALSREEAGPVVALPGVAKPPLRVRVRGHFGYAQAPSGTTTPPPEIMAVSLLPAGGPTGEVTLGGKTLRFLLIDGNVNGRYDDVLSGFSQEGPTMDGFALDLDGDGRFAPPNPSADAWEWSPLCRTTRVGDAYYALTAAADGSQVTFAKADPKFGTLDFGGGGADVLAFSEFGVQRIRPAEGKARLAAGKYWPVMITLKRADKDGAEWSLQGRGGGTSGFDVPADQTVPFKVGPPLVARTEFRRVGDQALIGLSLAGQGGEQYAPGAMKGQSRTDPPKFEIVDAAGKVLQAGQFEYG